MLFQLRDYIVKEEFVSDGELSRTFHLDNSALSPMLDLLVCKGAIKKYKEETNCQSKCRRCSSSCLEYYTKP